MSTIAEKTPMPAIQIGIACFSREPCAPRTMKPLVIQRSAGLFLLQRGFGNDERFRQLFRTAWRRIPFAYRRLMVKHWRCDDDPDSGIAWSPNIQLLVEWGDAEGWGAQRKDGKIWCMQQRTDEYAIMSTRGHRLFFYAPSIDAMPDSIVQDIIAHELAHVCQAAEGDERVPVEELRLLDPREMDANKIIADWDFDPDSVDVWEDERRAAAEHTQESAMATLTKG